MKRERQGDIRSTVQADRVADLRETDNAAAAK